MKWVHVLLLENYRLLDGRSLMRVERECLFLMSRGLEKVCIPDILIEPVLTFVDLGTLHSVGLPIHVYPLYENAFRAHRGQSILDNNHESAELYADFAKVAAKNPLAWNYSQPAATEEVIGTVSKKNRMICFPCMHGSELMDDSNRYRSSADERIQ